MTAGRIALDATDAEEAVSSFLEVLLMGEPLAPAVFEQAIDGVTAALALVTDHPKDLARALPTDLILRLTSSHSSMGVDLPALEQVLAAARMLIRDGAYLAAACTYLRLAAIVLDLRYGSSIFRLLLPEMAPLFSRDALPPEAALALEGFRTALVAGVASAPLAVRLLARLEALDAGEER
jgi:hypothetical protein